MKNSKRFLAMMTAGFLAITPMAATGLTAFAVNSSTLTVVDSDTVGHTYNAYQILKGKTEGGKLTSLSMGNGISQANLITAINTTLGSGTLEATASLDDIAAKLATIADDSANAAKLAKEMAQYKVLANAQPLSRASGTDNYTNSTLENGWYLILDETTLAAATTSDSTQVRSANILQLTQDSTINTKHSLPTLDKVIVESSTEKEANSAAIGDVITYNIKLNVPDVRGYDKYYYVVEDTLSSGLTYNNDLSVKLGGTALNEDTDDSFSDTTDTGEFYVTQNGTTIKVVFEDAVNYFKDKTVGAPIVISYTATLNSDAVIGDSGNPNRAKLIYSNDPNETGTGENEPGKPDEPSSSAPTGETPNDTVITYSTAIKVNKVDQDNQALKGAVFTLESNDFNEVKVVSGYKFEIDASGDYYKLADGSYTKTAPVSGGAAANPLYDAANIDNKFKKVYISSGTNDTIIEKANAASYTVEAQVDENGVITFNGLKPGTYTLSETVTPEGYNTASPVTITITATDSAGVLQAPSNWTVSGASYADNAFSLNVVNKQGATLPTTGGIGTKLFYIIGGLLVTGSVVLLVTKKRMKANEE